MTAATFHSLEGLWQQAETGFRVALLRGEAGLGKTHLVRQFASQALLQHGCCVQVPRGPLLPGLLEGLFGLLKAEHQPEFLSYARQLTPQLPWARVAAPPAAGAGSLWAAIYRAALKERRLCLLIEDVHEWSQDVWDQFQSLVVYLQERGAPVLLVLTARDDGAVARRWQRVQDWLAVSEGSRSETLTLAPLTQTGLGELVRTQLRTGEEVAGLAEWLYDHTRGSPLHSVLLLRLLRREGQLLDLGLTWDFRPLPTLPGRGELPIADLLHLELAALGGELDLQVLRALALAGEELTRAQLEQALGVRAGLLESRLSVLVGPYLEAGGVPGGLRLRHPLLAQAVRAELTWESEVDLAGQLLTVVRSQASRARLARTVGHKHELAWTREAMQDAQDRHAHAEVVEFAQCLLHAQPGDLAVKRQLWQAWVDLGDYAQLIAQGPTGDAHCDVHLANAHEVQGEYRRAIEVLEAVQDDGGRYWKILQRKLWCLDFLDDPPALLAELQRHSGQEHYVLEWAWAEYGRSQGDLPGRISHMQRALELLPADSPPLERAVIEGNLGAPMINTGQFGEAQHHLERAAGLFRQVGHTYGLLGCEINLAYLNLARGNYREAHRQNLKMYAATDRLQDTRLQSAVLSNLAACEVWMGQPERAVLNFQRSMETYSGYEAARASDLAYAQALSGLLPDAQETLQTPDHDPLPEHVLARARTWMLLGQTAEARAVLKAAAPSSQATPGEGANVARYALLCCWLCRLEGDLPAAMAELETATLALDSLAHLPLQEELTLVRRLLQGDLPAPVLLAHQQRLDELGAAGHLHLYRLTGLGALTPAGPEAGTRTLFVQTLGTFGLMEAGVLLPWRGRKTRDLLALLLTAHLNGAALSRSTLILELWPDVQDQNAEVNFRKTLERLRQNCGDAVTVVRDAQGLYSLSGLHADTPFFLAGLDSGDLEQAFSWYSGPYLPELEYGAVAEMRELLQQRLRGALLQSAQGHPPEQVLAWCERYLRHDPLDLEVAALALRQPHQAGSEGARKLRATMLGRFEKEWGFVPEELLKLK